MFHKNSDLFWKPYLNLQCDAANALVRISEKLEGFKCSPDWLSYLRSADDTKEAQNLLVLNISSLILT